ncbi:unnamed protein product [Cylindrotheca closterium]|uniref:Uncharacterized protein n=1 Tax=Cylindrotheca closterium TaxID=2856 RepID=A0AAD2JGS0_9STRA|nr:unnamed protein product [Cylindrotheca closterium]
MLLLAAPVAEAFVPVSKIASAANSKAGVVIPNKSTTIIHKPRTSVAMEAYKKRERAAKKAEEKEKTPPLTLFISYMTPWRNPNSIFLYMFLVVYLLGSYSEAKSAAGM